MNGPSTTRIDVVIGALVRRCSDGIPRMLLTQRLPDKSSPWLWECPGGKAEPGELLLQVLAREWWEELRIDLDLSNIGAANRIFSCDYDPPIVSQPYRITCFALFVVDRAIIIQPVPRASVGFGWFGAGELQTLPMALANADHREKLIEAVGGAL